MAANTAAETNNAAAATANSTHTQKKIVNNQYEINKTISSIVQVPAA